MDLYPAIDLLDGQCVRLRRGDFAQVTVYSRDPLQVAREFSRAGARWIHVVDLDGARSGRPSHLPLVARMAALEGVRLQLGGGIRTLEALRQALESGAARCVMGTGALDAELLARAVEEFSSRLAVGVDVDGGTVRVAGWTADSGVPAARFLGDLSRAAVRWIVVTDISRDGMLSGPNVPLLREAAGLGMGVIASGGVSGLEDLRTLKREVPALAGVIAGKAIYERRFSVAEGVALLEGGAHGGRG